MNACPLNNDIDLILFKFKLALSRINYYKCEGYISFDIFFSI